MINDMRLEYVVSVEGTVRTRPDESINKKMKTGVLEVYIYIYILYVMVLTKADAFSMLVGIR